MVTIPPLEGLVEALAADCDVRVLVTPGASAHGWEPSAEDIARLRTADAVVMIGLGLEPAVEHQVRAMPGVSERTIVLADEIGLHDEAPHPEPDDEPHHDHGAIDPHIWLDIESVRAIVPALAIRLTDLAIAPGPDIDTARDGLLKRIDDLDQRYAQVLAPYRGRSVITNHGAFNRLLERYGLRVAGVLRPIETAEPSPQHLAELVQAIGRDGVRAVFMEPQADPRPAQNLARQTGVAIGTLDPLGSGDWFEMMDANLEALVAAMRAGDAG